MMGISLSSKIIVTGAAGLVGQNLCLRLTQAGYTNIWGYDKHVVNTKILCQTQPNIRMNLTDLADKGAWQQDFKDADIVILNQAQIGGLVYEEFERNNITATNNILDAVSHNAPPYIVHISSSVINSVADDFYTRSKIEQEKIVRKCGFSHCILRPTLMFGWFDRKHLGWLRRFMAKTPVFPIPGNGSFLRQPLYAGDFCNVIRACMEQQPDGEIFDVSGQEKIDYIDLIKIIKKQTGLRTMIVKIPYFVFKFLLWCASLVMKNPPFTTAQLKALIIPEEFPVENWPDRFGIKATSFEDAVNESYMDPIYSKITLAF